MLCLAAQRKASNGVNMIEPEQAFLVPQNLDEAETLVNKLTIENLRAFCFTFGLSQDGTKASLKERLKEY